MTTIHILDKNTDALVGFLDNEGPNMYWNDVHVRDLRNNEETFSFVMPSTIQEAGKIAHRSRLLIPDGRGAFREFIVFDENTSINYQKAIVSTATYMDLDKQFILPPGTYTGTVVEHLALVLPNTEWQAGTIEYAGIRTITIDDYTGAYSYILKLLSAFESEVNFRVETNGNQIVGRYVDFLERIGEVTQKEIEIGKDLVDMEMRIYSDRVVTALLCIGPEKSDGTRLTTIVVDDDAFQRWNRNGKHVFGLYEPESSNADMTLEQLQQYGRTELNKRIAAVVEYRVTAQKLNEAHEAVNIGDTVRIKNPRFVPALYANARIVRVERSIADDRLTVYEIGEVVLYDVNSINKTLANMRALYDKRIAMKNANHKQATKPDLATSVDGDRWENTAENNRIYTFSSTTGDYEPTILGSEALNVPQVSDLTDDLGVINIGILNGVLIRGSRFESLIPGSEHGLILENGFGLLTNGTDSSVWDEDGFAIFGGLPPGEPGATLLARFGISGIGHGILTTQSAAVIKSNGSSDDVVLDPGSGFVTVDGQIRNESLITMSLANGWQHFSSVSEPWQRAEYWKDKNGVVHLAGLIKNGTTTNGTILNEPLPVGYRPAKQEVFLVATITGVARIDVYPNGQIIGARDLNATWTSLSGISFKAV